LLRNQQEVPCNPRYTADATDLLLQGASEAAVGVASQLGLTDAELHERMLRGVAAIVDEFEAHLVQTAIANTGDVLSCVENLHRLEDVLHEPANCSEMQWRWGLEFGKDTTTEMIERNERRPFLADYLSHANAVQAQLTESQVVALRLYTTTAFTSINGSLRDKNRVGNNPFAATISILKEGLCKLRAIQAPSASSQQEGLQLWRSMQHATTPEAQMRTGGTELGLQSFTPKLDEAVGFASSCTSLLLLINSDVSFMQGGVALQWVSVVPFEQEYVLPPCTYLEPTGRRQTIDLPSQQACTVVEVVPHVGS